MLGVWPRRSQQVLPAQPKAGGEQGAEPHCFARAAQTWLKQLPEQQSLACWQGWPLATLHVPPVQQVVPVGQVAHC